MKKRLFLILGAIFATFFLSGCSRENSAVEIKPDQETQEKLVEQEKQIAELQQYKEEQQRLADEQKKQEEINVCKEAQNYCNQRLSVIGVEEVKLYNGKGEYVGTVSGDRNKAIEREQEEMEDNKKDLKKFTAENILEAAKRSIKIHEEMIAAIKVLIIKEQQEKNSLLSGKCVNYKNPCE